MSQDNLQNEEFFSPPASLESSEDMAKEIESKTHMPLYSSKEFKKVRIEYFTPAFEAWENKYKNISKEL